ncbi:MAG: bifunctional riboflavin kinase/FAD synthetase [Oscillospiraceae bacterium]
MKIIYDIDAQVSKSPRAIALGFFDGVHKGHMAVLQAAVSHEKEGLLPSAFTFVFNDKSRPFKKQKSLAVQTVNERSECMENMGIKEVLCPDFTSFMDLSAEEFAVDIMINKYNAKVICCGEDFHFGKGAKATAKDLYDICKKHNITLEIVPEVLFDGEPISSTRIRQAVADADIQLANNLLGRFYSFTSLVIHGRKLGRTLGFPTINQRFPQGHTIPKFGVYATIITLENGEKYVGTTDVGIKPTVGSDEILAETFILDFDKDVYGQNVKVEFVKFLREEKKFGDLDELSAMIKKNSSQAYELCSKLI